jgi:hypothetical protein
MDHYPTMLEIVGEPLRPGQHVDGRSYASALRGEAYQRDPMFWYKWLGPAPLTEYCMKRIKGASVSHVAM